jgi:hypothetical protein
LCPATKNHAAWSAGAAQLQAGSDIQAGQPVPIAAPTGSGKTLAAFLAANEALITHWNLIGIAAGRLNRFEVWLIRWLFDLRHIGAGRLRLRRFTGA